MNDLDMLMNKPALELTGVDDPILDKIIAHYRKIRGLGEEGGKNTKAGGPKLDAKSLAVSLGLKKAESPFKRRF